MPPADRVVGFPCVGSDQERVPDSPFENVSTPEELDREARLLSQDLAQPYLRRSYKPRLQVYSFVGLLRLQSLG